MNITFIAQDLAKIPTKTRNENTRDTVMLTIREESAFSSLADLVGIIWMGGPLFPSGPKRTARDSLPSYGGSNDEKEISGPQATNKGLQLVSFSARRIGFAHQKKALTMMTIFLRAHCLQLFTRSTFARPLAVVCGVLSLKIRVSTARRKKKWRRKKLDFFLFCRLSHAEKRFSNLLPTGRRTIFDLTTKPPAEPPIFLLYPVDRLITAKFGDLVLYSGDHLPMIGAFPCLRSHCFVGLLFANKWPYSITALQCLFTTKRRRTVNLR